MKIAFFSTQPYDRHFFDCYNDPFGFELEYFDTPLNRNTTGLISQCEAVCIFVNDHADAATLQQLADKGVKIIALRCAGFNNIDLGAAKTLGLRVCRVPAYSPEAVAEHALAMILTLNRKTHKAYNRVREQNFALNGLLGFDMHGKTIGVVGTGNIGKAFCTIVQGFGCKMLAFDLVANRELEQLGVEFVPLIDLLQQSDIISLHCPLTDQTRHLVNTETMALMKNGVMIINTSRGGLIDTASVIEGLKSCKIGYLGIDVYEQEEKLFFRDLSDDIIQDDMIQRLMSFPNVLVTAHQAFFTKEALTQIALTTLKSIDELHRGNNLTQKAALLV
ncbi:2-hydroxyacid dehydrogenase [Deminuibacter soli]|uniref:2-hydroxyacid dehydrogenase n=1 Tax=Deminuibacter soli TaxID=2291815 RepID=A0A3E1NPE1_9BACT|nr:2-hydroxyacid dehydrogenase [Deminuibacter soli]RFM29694.1 2-hydroxyacid dehydrogenase [Deminuibacter soli]